MDIHSFMRRQARSVIGPLIGFTLSGYFALNLMGGERGLTAWIRLSEEIRDAKHLAEQIHAERETEERRVSLLRPEHLDLDMLDEQVRAAKNLVAKGDVVILNDTQNH